MKIAFLAGPNAVHTIRWVNSLCDRGHDVYLFTLHRQGNGLDPRVKKVILPFPPPIGYYFNFPFLRYKINKIKPDLLNAHYASGYGTLGRLSRYHPYVLSVWGSDVYDFPCQSSLNNKLIVKNLESSDRVCSTSFAMAKVTKKICPSLKSIDITPFGVDIKKFSPKNLKENENTITIGTVKSLETKYGIDLLIHSFALTRKTIFKTQPDLAKKLRLLIVGGGSEYDNLAKLATEAGIAEVTRFEGPVQHTEVPNFLSKLDIYVALSRLDSESFGVAIIEASACGIPVIVSNTDGPSEVVEHEKTGIIIAREDINASAKAMEKLILQPELRSRLGLAGRNHVIKHYDWEKSVDIMEQVYRKAISYG